MNIAYCDKWSNVKKKPWKMIDENMAKLLHAKRQPYAAVLSENEQPRFVIDIANNSVSVNFFDNLIRKYLQYDFQEIEKGKLFLKTAIYWEYEDDTDSKISGMIFGYQENGNIVMEIRNLKTGESEERETHDSVERNWEDYPTFGQYLYLCKEER